MRILLVSPADEAFGGVASVVGNLARYLQSHGHEVIFLHSGRALLPKKKTTKWGFLGFDLRLQALFGKRHPLVSLALFLFFFPIGIYQLARLIQKHRIEIINIHFPSDYCFYFGLCRRILSFRLVTSVHGADFFPSGNPKPRYSRLIRFLLSASDLIVAPSESYRKDFLSVFPALNEKTIFIHNGIDLDEMGAPQEGNRSDQDRYILCIAAHNLKKGLDVLIRAVALLRDVDPSFKVLLVGDGPLREELEELVRSLGIEERIRFLGRQERHEVVSLIHGCEAVVLPSRSEPFGIAVIEGMACKKPVVATAVGGIPEIIENGKNGILVEPDSPAGLAEALITVLRDPALQRAIASNGYATVHERFRSEKTGSTYETVFAYLLDSTKKVQGRQAAGAVRSSTCSEPALKGRPERL
jgi:L-malate glycosyltransferase